MMIYLSRDTWMALQDMSSADVADAICDSQAIVEAIQSDAWSDVADIVRARVELKAKRIAQGVMEPETLYWHAFNYRQVHTTQAHEMWEKLEQFVDSKIKTPQRTWVELTDEQINAIGEKMFGAIKEALALQDLHSENERLGLYKDAYAQPEQEPVAWKHPDKNMVFWDDTKELDEYHGFKPTIPLYTHPPQRTWVELTDEQINAIGEKMFGRFGYEGKSDRKFARYIEAKLKEKNT